MLNEGKISAFSKSAGSTYNYLYDYLGFKPTNADIKSSYHGSTISYEGIKDANPSVIFTIDRTTAIGGDASKDNDLLDNSLVKQTTAAKKNKIIKLTSDMWYLSGGGLQSTKLMLNELYKAVK